MVWTCACPCFAHGGACPCFVSQLPPPDPTLGMFLSEEAIHFVLFYSFWTHLLYQRDINSLNHSNFEESEFFCCSTLCHGDGSSSFNGHCFILIFEDGNLRQIDHVDYNKNLNHSFTAADVDIACRYSGTPLSRFVNTLLCPASSLNASFHIIIQSLTLALSILQAI